MPPRIPVDRAAIAAFCRRYGIRRLSLFGSVLRSDFRAESDVDVLVEFVPGRVPGFFGLVDMQDELSAMLGRRVDLRTPQDLSRYFRSEVVASAEVQFAEG
ncbi:MAG: nucleotidyltransferase family protein [Euryarchaeota archaeon]|nr:nucleotidyltransferase family protein [Euryarchaeota archaeon]